MKLGKIAAAAAAVTLATAPIAAQADIGSRAAAPVAGEELGAGNSGAVLALFAIFALTVGIVASGGDDDAISV